LKNTRQWIRCGSTDLPSSDEVTLSGAVLAGAVLVELVEAPPAGSVDGDADVAGPLVVPHAADASARTAEHPMAMRTRNRRPWADAAPTLSHGVGCWEPATVAVARIDFRIDRITWFISVSSLLLRLWSSSLSGTSGEMLPSADSNSINGLRREGLCESRGASSVA
jgi:hypothetical protein